ncbi:hypothetical protein CEP54_015577 [Fusarium duplospermum]|uniref:Dynamin-type G domain-containing protein n=1 Tax=Fusarium duplospermum TaxID=1325734 RepID=A0A428NN10_9HYPO|nr:hypothetical protein CEP54_015577 [Fusarium duplospermum]
MAFLNQLSDSYTEVFDAIDSLRDAGIGSELIPKLVVIGDQNSGKSSVLEAICDIPFPVKEGLCTRFPTEVAQRKSSQELITVTIVGDGANNGDLARLSRELSLDNSEGLATAIEQASSLIMSRQSGPGNERHFSGKILKITVSGPGRYPLTVVDLPGLFHSSTSDQNKEDRTFVREMMRRYIKEPRNALLPVLSASGAWTNMLIPEEIVDTKADSDGKRSLGIITKLDKLGDLQELESWLAHEGDWKPQHGWHFLRNRSHEERSRGVDRDTIETAFFKENLVEKDERFNLLGKGRSSEREQRDYLAHMAGNFQMLCCSAVNGQYGEGTVPVRLQAFFNDPKDPGGLSRRSQYKRLQAVMRAMNLLFNSTMKEKGKRMKVSEHDPDDGSMSDTTSDYCRRSRDLEIVWKDYGKKTPKYGDEQGSETEDEGEYARESEGQSDDLDDENQEEAG